jgi:hypothetical protein
MRAPENTNLTQIGSSDGRVFVPLLRRTGERNRRTVAEWTTQPRPNVLLASSRRGGSVADVIAPSINRRVQLLLNDFRFQPLIDPPLDGRAAVAGLDGQHD